MGPSLRRDQEGPASGFRASVSRGCQQLPKRARSGRVGPAVAEGYSWLRKGTSALALGWEASRAFAPGRSRLQLEHFIHRRGARLCRWRGWASRVGSTRLTRKHWPMRRTKISARARIVAGWALAATIASRAMGQRSRRGLRTTTTPAASRSGGWIAKSTLCSRKTSTTGSRLRSSRGLLASKPDAVPCSHRPGSPAAPQFSPHLHSPAA